MTLYLPVNGEQISIDLHTNFRVGIPDSMRKHVPEKFASLRFGTRFRFERGYPGAMDYQEGDCRIFLFLYEPHKGPESFYSLVDILEIDPSGLSKRPWDDLSAKVYELSDDNAYLCRAIQKWCEENNGA